MEETTIGTVAVRLNKELGVIVRESRVRRYTEWGLIPFRKAKNGYVYFDENSYQKAKIVCMLADCGVSILNIKNYLNGNKEMKSAIWERLKGIELCVSLAKKYLREN